jgi:hypothetical protein
LQVNKIFSAEYAEHAEERVYSDFLSATSAVSALQGCRIIASAMIVTPWGFRTSDDENEDEDDRSTVRGLRPRRRPRPRPRLFPVLGLRAKPAL